MGIFKNTVDPGLAQIIYALGILQAIGWGTLRHVGFLGGRG